MLALLNVKHVKTNPLANSYNETYKALKKKSE